MSTPTAPWIDLRPYDVTAQTLVERAVAAAQTRLPAWVPREGLLEMAIIEAVAIDIEAGIFATHRLTTALLRGVLRLMGVTIRNGTAPTGEVRFTVADTAGHTIPADTRLRYRSAGQRPVEMLLRTTEECVIAFGQTTGTAAVVGAANSDAANGAPAGSALDMLDAQAWVEAVALSAPLLGGERPETEDVYVSRGVERLARMTDTLVVPFGFEAFAREWAGVERALALAATVPGHATGDDPGHVTVLVLGQNGGAVPSPTMELLLDSIQARAAADLVAHVAPVVPVAVNVTATVRRFAGYSAAAVEASCIEALHAFLDPDYWQFGTDVAANELIEVLGRDTVGVDLVVSVVPSVTTIGPTEVATRGTFTVTVVDP